MKLLLTAIALLPLLLPTAAHATQATGRVANGFYWLLTDAGQWHCKSTSTGKIQRHQLCINAGAVKPKAGQFLR